MATWTAVEYWFTIFGLALLTLGLKFLIGWFYHWKARQEALGLLHPNSIPGHRTWSFLTKRCILLSLENHDLRNQLWRRDQKILALEDDKYDLERRHKDLLRVRQ